MPRCPPATARQRGAVHGGLRRGRRWRTWPIRSWTRSPHASARCKVGAGTDPDAEMGPLVTQGAPRQGGRLSRHRIRRRRRGRRRRPGPGQPGRRVLPRPLPGRPRAAGHEDLPGRGVRAGAVGGAGRQLSATRYGWSTTTATATAWPSSPGTAARPAGSWTRPTSAWSGSTCPSRSRSRSTRSAGGRTRCSATCTCTGRTVIRFYTHAKVVTTRWPDPSTSTVDLGFPRTR